MDKNILNKIKQVRITSGLSARRLGILSGLSVTTITNFEHGITPSVKNLAKILHALNLHINEKVFTKLLKDKRKELDATFEKMGRLAGLSHTIMHQIEQGKMPSLKTCCIIANELNLSFDEIINWPMKLIKPK